MRAILPLLLCTALRAAVDGDPAAPYPYADPAWWADTTNDSVISGREHDDGLSAQVRAGGEGRVAWGAAWDLDTAEFDRNREDEFTLDAGPEVARGLRVMPGLRLTGDLDGGRVQNSLHRGIGAYHVDCTYGGAPLRVEPVLLASYRVEDPSGVGRAGVVGCLSPGLQQADATVGVRASSHLEAEAGWVASRCRSPSAAVRMARGCQRGPHAGLAVQGLHAGYGVEWGEHECIGRVGLVF